MDQNINQQNQATSSPSGNLLTQEQKDAFFKDLGLENISAERKDSLMEKMVDSVMNRIFARIIPALSDDDAKALSEIEKQDDADTAVNAYIVSKVPSFNQITAEEIEKFKAEMKDSLQAIKASMP